MRLDAGLSLCRSAFHPGWFMLDPWWTKWLRLPCVFPCKSPFHHCSLMSITALSGVRWRWPGSTVSHLLVLVLCFITALGCWQREGDTRRGPHIVCVSLQTAGTKPESLEDTWFLQVCDYDLSTEEVTSHKSEMRECRWKYVLWNSVWGNMIITCHITVNFTICFCLVSPIKYSPS